MKKQKNKQEKINKIVKLAFITDSGYAMPTVVAIQSAICNKKDDSIYEVNILGYQLSEDVKEKFYKLETDTVKIKITEISNLDKFNGIKQSRYITPTALLKFDLPIIFKQDEKILYLDGDLLVQGDLLDFYNTSLDGYYGAVVKDAVTMTLYLYHKSSVCENEDYFNSGVLLLNLEKMREDDCSRKLLDWRMDNGEFYMDQDALNVILGDKVKYLNCWFNFLVFYPDKHNSEKLSNFYNTYVSPDKVADYKRAIILHYAGPKKPWVYKMLYLTEQFCYYYKQSPYKNIKIKFKNFDDEKKIFGSFISSRIESKHKIYTIGTKVIDMNRIPEILNKKGTSIDVDYIPRLADNAIPVIYSANDAYVPYLAVSIQSLISHSNDSNVYEIIVLESSISEANKKILLTMERPNVSIRFFNVKSFVSKYNFFINRYFSVETYYRIFIADICSQYDKVVYLDCDILVRSDIADLYNINMGKKVIMATNDIVSYPARTKNYKIYDIYRKDYTKNILKMPDTTQYFQAGILVFNVSQMREENLTQVFLKKIEEIKNPICHDQDILNTSCYGKVLYISQKWNFYNFFNEESLKSNYIRGRFNDIPKDLQGDYLSAQKDPKLVHFAGDQKVWFSKHLSFGNEWWQCAKKTPFYEEIVNRYNSYQNKNSKAQLIVSLTSYPARIETVNQTIKSILNQSIKADKVILWLAPEQFPNKEKDLPEQLLSLRAKGLTIDWYHDIKSYKKLIPTLKKYPDAIIVTADDDNIYAVNWLEKLYNSYIKHPQDISCHRITKFINNGSHFSIITGGHDYYKKSSYLNKLVGLGGVLYPPHCFYKDILNEDLIMKLAPTNDDQWFWFQAMLNHVKVRVVDNPIIAANYVPGSQQVGLCKVNDQGQNLFWADYKRIINYYPEIRDIMNKESKQFKIQPVDNKYLSDLKKWYMSITGKYLNLDNPKTFNEKIQWLKLYNSTPIKTRLADKYLVRDWVKEKIGEQYLIPLLGVYDKFDDIDFNKLPNQFVIKCNHGAGWNIIVKDKSKLDLAEAKAKVDKWISTNFAFYYGFELHYRDIKPRIIIEKYMEDDSGNLRDYKFLCFDGIVKYIWVDGERYSEHKRNLYDLKWNLLNKKIGEGKIYQNIKNCPKPYNLDKMIEFATLLSKGFSFVRVDFFEANKKLYFGEMTFTSASGTHITEPKSFIFELGKMIKLPKLAYDINTGEYYKLPKRSKIKPYLLLPYNLCQKVYWNYKEKKIQRKYIQKQLLSSRIDIKNNGTEQNRVKIIASNCKIETPSWFTNAQGVGQVVEYNNGIQKMTIKVIQDGRLYFAFRGIYKHIGEKNLPIWIDYKSIKIDGKEILSAPVQVWHDKPYRYEIPVKDGQTIEIEVIQGFHQYTKQELKELILKLNPKSYYIQKNIDKLISKIYNKIKVKPQEKKCNRAREGLFSITKKDYSKEICLLGIKFKFKNKQKQLLYVLEKNRAEMINLLKDSSTKISVQDKKIGELQKKIQNFEKKIDHSVKYNLGENFEELRREFKENILSLDKALNSTQISLQNDLAELKSVDFLTRQSFEKASLDTHQNILDRLRDVYEGVRNLNFAKDADLKALVSDLYLKLEDKNVVDANNVAEILEKILVCKMDTQNAIKTLEGIQNKAIENIEEVKLQQYKNYSELNFADLLHDSMQNRDWLKDKNFSLYLGAANYSFIYTLFRVLDNVNPQNILEMGMGQTSKLTSQYVAYKNQNATLDIIENDADWIDIYQSQLPLNERVKIHLCNLEFFEFKGVENRKYRALDNVIKDKKYNLVIVDGPLGSRQLLPRSNIIDIVMSNLADDFIIIFDDAERKGEQETISQTKAKLTELGIEFTTQQRDALKSQFIIFSKSFNFARFL